MRSVVCLCWREGEGEGRRKTDNSFVPSGPARAKSIFCSTIVLAAAESRSPPK